MWNSIRNSIRRSAAWVSRGGREKEVGGGKRVMGRCGDRVFLGGSNVKNHVFLCKERRKKKEEEFFSSFPSPISSSSRCPNNIITVPSNNVLLLFLSLHIVYSNSHSKSDNQNHSSIFSV
jgi:hypothetical protein